jgi:hypothetical protein
MVINVSYEVIGSILWVEDGGDKFLRNVIMPRDLVV